MKLDSRNTYIMLPVLVIINENLQVTRY